MGLGLNFSGLRFFPSRLPQMQAWGLGFHASSNGKVDQSWQAAKGN